METEKKTLIWSIFIHEISVREDSYNNQKISNEDLKWT